MIARVHIIPAEWAGAEGILVDVLRAGQDQWAHVGLYALYERIIDVEVQSGDKIRAAGFRRGDVPHGAPADVVALQTGEYVGYTVA